VHSKVIGRNQSYNQSEERATAMYPVYTYINYDSCMLNWLYENFI